MFLFVDGAANTAKPQKKKCGITTFKNSSSVLHRRMNTGGEVSSFFI